MDPYPEQQREMSIPIRTKEDTPSFVAGNTLRDLSPMRDMTPPECHDMTCPKCHAEDPEAFQAALTIMNLNAADRNLGLKDDDQQGVTEESFLEIENGDLVITQRKRIPLFRPMEQEIMDVDSGSDAESSFAYQEPYFESDNDAELSVTYPEPYVESGSDAGLSITTEELNLIIEGGVIQDEEEGGSLFDHTKRRGAKLPIPNEEPGFVTMAEVEGPSLYDRIKQFDAELPFNIQDPNDPFAFLDDEESGNLFDRIKRRGRRGKASGQERRSRSPSPTGNSKAHLRQRPAVAQTGSRKQSSQQRRDTLMW